MIDAFRITNRTPTYTPARWQSCIHARAQSYIFSSCPPCPPPKKMQINMKLTSEANKYSPPPPRMTQLLNTNSLFFFYEGLVLRLPGGVGNVRERVLFAEGNPGLHVFVHDRTPGRRRPRRVRFGGPQEENLLV